MLLTEKILIALSKEYNDYYEIGFRIKHSYFSPNQHVAAYLMEDLRLLNRIQFKDCSTWRKFMKSSGGVTVLDHSPTGYIFLDKMLRKIDWSRKSLFDWIRFFGRKRYQLQEQVILTMKHDKIIRNYHRGYKFLNPELRDVIRELVRTTLTSGIIPNQEIQSFLALCAMMKKWYIQHGLIGRKEFSRSWFKKLRNWLNEIARENIIAYWLQYAYRQGPDIPVIFF
ncbi:MAG: hypothetical protein ACFFAS_15490 [Promethearchaeota archaeon]